MTPTKAARPTAKPDRARDLESRPEATAPQLQLVAVGHYYPDTQRWVIRLPEVVH